METNEEKLWNCNSCELKVWFIRNAKEYRKKHGSNTSLKNFEISFSIDACSELCFNLTEYFLTKELHSRGINIECR
jgi:hypothetical protein